ncbi:MAG: protein TolQ [Methyloprofundus sp.]|nr:protein TolQ [Methyloprofundus sp.]
MTNDLSIFYLITQASFVVQLVMLILLIASLLSWTCIRFKYKELKRALQVTDQFDAEFWSGGDLSALYKKITTADKQAEGIEKIFIAGYKEFSRMHSVAGVPANEKIDNAQRVMRIELARELDRLDENLPFLATVGSTSPYVGLFGTVWGIMNSFRSLSSAKQATLAQVAPGIAEALVATAIGLFAAIPAVVAYNHFATGIDRLSGRYELFIDEFVVLLQRQAYS